MTRRNATSLEAEPPSPAGLLTYDYQSPLFTTQNPAVPSLFHPYLRKHQTRQMIRSTTTTRRHLYLNKEEENENQHSLSSSIAGSTSLVDKIIGDVAIGIASTFCVAPFLTIVDKAIVQRAAGTHTLLTSGFETMATIVKNPIQYVKSPIFLYMWAVYGATYSTANSLKTIMEHKNEHRNTASSTTTRMQGSDEQASQNARASSSSGSMVTFLGTSIVNSGGSLLKDRAYAQMFSGNVAGATHSVKSFPKISYGLWMTRDFLVIGSGFVLPDIVSQQLHERYNERIDLATCKQLSQVTLPIITQFIAGPLQLLGLDFYNRPLSGMSTRAAIIDRGTFLLNGYTSVVTARIARIIPGYSIGGVLNTSLRDKYRTYLKDRAELQQINKLEQEPREEQYNSYFNHHRPSTAVMSH